MKRCLDLATLGFPGVMPNPMVGCVIVKDGQVISEGYHKAFGQPHAEAMAIAAVKDREILKESTLFVNLEPCAHEGKTPPCADLIIENSIPKVVVAMEDPNPLVKGVGIQRMKDAGTEVGLGLLEDDAKFINRRFICFYKQNRPYVILKWAQTQDGYLADDQFQSKWISNDISRMLVHKWRTEEQAIMVGTQTALIDNPKLTSREWKGKNPMRVLIDRDLKVAVDARIFEKNSQVKVFNNLKSGSDELLEYVKLDFEKGNVLQQILEWLRGIDVQSIIVEGGGKLLHSFIESGLWDEARVFQGQKQFRKGIAAPAIHGKWIHESKVGRDNFNVYLNQDLY